MAVVELTVRGKNETAPARQGVLDLDAALGMVKKTAAALGVSLSVMALVKLGEEATMMAARYNTLGVTMTVVGNNAGYTGAQMADLETKLRKTGIAAIESRQNLTTMAQAHIDLANSTKLAREAQDAAVIGGINSSEAFSRMIVGIQSGQVEILRTIGINVNFEQSYRKLSQQLGKSTDDLTEMEKTQARTNAVLEKGKDIAGAYEAAMGTAGKQVSSMKRYVDDLKVKVGEVFQDALIVGVSAFTDGLKGANSEADRLQREGKLKEWGKDVVYIMAVVGDAIHIVYLSMYTLVSAGVAGLVQLYYGAKMFGQAMTLNFSGAAESFSEMKNAGAAWWQMTKDKWSGATMFQDATKKMYSTREANAAKDKTLSAEQEKQRMAAAEASRKEQQAQEAAALAEKKYIENLKYSLEGIKDYANAMKDLGKERLKFAEAKFSDQLKAEVELFSQGKNAMSDMIAPLKRYNVEVNDVFNQRLAIERGALNKIAGLYSDFKAKVSLSANAKEVRQHGVEIVKAYKDAAEQIIGIEQARYTTLYEGERKLYEQFKSLNDAKKKELEEFRQMVADMNKADETARRSAVGDYSGGYEYLDPALDALAKRQAMEDKLRRDEAAALSTADSAKRKTALLDVANGYDQIKTSVELAGQTVITTEQAQQSALENKKRILGEIESDLETQQTNAAKREAESAARLDTYMQKLIGLDDILKNMTRTITIDLKVNGMEQINKIQGFVGAAVQSPFSSTESAAFNASTTLTSSIASNASAPITTPVAAPESPSAQGDTHINIPGGVTVVLQSSGQADSDANAVARNLIPAIKREISRSLAG